MALYNGGDSLLAEAWMGLNDAGFAIMNTASYNLAPDTASVKDREGIVMRLALERCRTLDDFETLLDTLPRPLGVQANFGVLDASAPAPTMRPTTIMRQSSHWRTRQTAT